jgi:type IV pilus assembly protein PilA
MIETSERGFSLVELLIVVAIILILASLAIPDLLRSRMAANQASAVASLRIIGSAEISYSSTYAGGYSSTLAQLDGNVNPATSLAAGLIDSALGAGMKSGYNLYYVPCVSPGVPNNGALAPGPCGASVYTYQVSANPISGPGNGNFYFTDPSSVIHQNSVAPAGVADTPLGG